MALFANMTKREQYFAGAGLIAVLVLAAYWYFLYKPRAAELAADQVHVDSLDKLNHQGKASNPQGSHTGMAGTP